MSDQAWPKDNYFHGTNEREHDIGAFGKLLQEAVACDLPFWCMDSDLKYLNIRIDTRDGGFIIKDRNGNRISPDRVVQAIEKTKIEFPSPPLSGQGDAS